ncbi:MAG: dephospho-CoA kinase [Lacibacter sp.]
MLKIGLTGGIGSGKSTIAAVFEILDIPVYYADTSAKELMNKNELLKQQLIFRFGEETFTEGKLNRKHLAEIVFSSKEKLDLLNSIVHPATIADAEQWFKKQHAPYVVKEAALLFESGSAEDLDMIIGVAAPEVQRIKRVMDRDAVTAAEVKRRMKNQLDEHIKIKLCDYVIYNDEQQMVLPQVLKIHEELIKRSGKKQQ